MEQHTELAAESPPGENPVLEAILRLPMDYKTVVYLYYYEGYTTRGNCKSPPLPPTHGPNPACPCPKTTETDVRR